MRRTAVVAYPLARERCRPMVARKSRNSGWTYTSLWGAPGVEEREQRRGALVTESGTWRILCGTGRAPQQEQRSVLAPEIVTSNLRCTAPWVAWMAQGPGQLPCDATQQSYVTAFEPGTLTDPPHAHKTPCNRVRARETVKAKRGSEMSVHRLNLVQRGQRRPLMRGGLVVRLHNFVA
jgi:hypothetical protein